MGVLQLTYGVIVEKEKTVKVHVEITPSALARLRSIGGTIKNGLELASFATDLTELHRRREEHRKTIVVKDAWSDGDV
jgi:hypothetical protein